MEVAAQMSLRPDVVEKDYVLGWLLAGIGQHPDLGPAWVFKGGTCLKKCFFETYRFSEDLDFTVINQTLLTVDVLQRSSDQISAWIYEQTGIEFPTNAGSSKSFSPAVNPPHKVEFHIEVHLRQGETSQK